MDGAFEQVLPWQLPVACVNLGPTVDRSWHGDGVDADRWHFLDLLFRENRRRESFWCGTGRVETDIFAGFGVPIKDEQVAADSIHHGFNEPKDGVGRDCGVGGGAATLQDVHSR